MALPLIYAGVRHQSFAPLRVSMVDSITVSWMMCAKAQRKDFPQGLVRFEAGHDAAS